MITTKFVYLLTIKNILESIKQLAIPVLGNCRLLLKKKTILGENPATLINKLTK